VEIKQVMDEIEKAEGKAIAILDAARKEADEIAKKADDEISNLGRKTIEQPKQKRHTGHDKTAGLKIDKKRQDNAVKHVVAEFKKKFG